ncbi:MAG TPA: RNA 3'-terminal phosphate cyclase, partial [Planctomycetaceae bacterium]|nr:RNA 3'-terminal phosphate cyclase [Planctomycetaceae bacterium]
SEAFLPLIERMGPKVTATLKRHGFFPAGGGRLVVRIEPVTKLQPLELLERGEVLHRQCRIAVASLPRTIADREWHVVHERLNWPDDTCQIVTLPPGCGPGNVMSLLIQSQQLTEVFTGFGAKGVSSEQVARAATDEACGYLATDVPVGPHLADQLLLPLALAGAGSFRTSRPSSHTTTNIDVISRFLDVPIRVEQSDPQRWQVTVGP